MKTRYTYEWAARRKEYGDSLAQKLKDADLIHWWYHDIRTECEYIPLLVDYPTYSGLRNQYLKSNRCWFSLARKEIKNQK